MQYDCAFVVVFMQNSNLDLDVNNHRKFGKLLSGREVSWSQDAGVHFPD